MKKIVYACIVCIPLCMQAADDQKQFAFDSGKKSAALRLYSNMQNDLIALAYAESLGDDQASVQRTKQIGCTIGMLKVMGIPSREIEATMVKRVGGDGSHRDQFLSIMKRPKD